MDSLAARVLRTIRRHDLLTPAAGVAVAVSGGSDSVALLHLLLDVQPVAGFRIAGLAHVHHGLRGPAADADEAFCRELAAALTLPIVVERADVRARAARERRSLEDAARAARYEALGRAAAVLDAQRIAVGHTLDDQAETVLLKLLRGTGTAGLAGIHPRHGAIIRPLLDIERDELRDWLRSRGLRFVEDETNADIRLRRNAVRHRVIPVLREHFGPAVAAVLARHAEVAREDEAELARAAARLADCVIRHGSTEILIEWEALVGASPAMQRRVAREALRRAGAREPGLDHVLQLLRVARGEDRGLALPGGLRASRRAGRLVLSLEPPEAAPFSYDLQVPGSVWVPEAGRTVDAQRVDAAAPEVAARLASADPHAAVIDADELSPSLTVRSWRAGDRFRPLGLAGRKKLQDLFVDRKVPPAERVRLPLVVDGGGRIVWVPGHAIDETCRVTEGTRAVVVLTMSEFGGRG
jgi:tRNA(Ile)-lysidine synthase